MSLFLHEEVVGTVHDIERDERAGLVVGALPEREFEHDEQQRPWQR
jgi:hypothetical protein